MRINTEKVGCRDEAAGMAGFHGQPENSAIMLSKGKGIGSDKGIPNRNSHAARSP